MNISRKILLVFGVFALIGFSLGIDTCRAGFGKDESGICSVPCTGSFYNDGTFSTCEPCNKFVSSAQLVEGTPLRDIVNVACLDPATGYVMVSDDTQAVEPKPCDVDQGWPDCAPCGAGEYSFGGTMACTKVPINARVNNADRMVACLAGFSKIAEQTTCQTTLAGYFSPVDCDVAIQCPFNFYSREGAAACTKVPTNAVPVFPAGTASASAGAVGFRCIDGYHIPDFDPHNVEDDTECVPVDAGYFGPVLSDDGSNVYYADQQPCDPGTFSRVAASVCVACPDVGYYTGMSTFDRQSCICGFNEETGRMGYSVNGGTCGAVSHDSVLDPETHEPTVCGAGTVPDPTANFGYGECVVCPPGSFAADGHCQTCPHSFFCENGLTHDCLTLTGREYCSYGLRQECDRGFVNNARIACESCKTGFQCDGGVMTPCKAGTYSNESTDHRCVTCFGMTPPNNLGGYSTCMACQDGEVPDSSFTTCIACEGERFAQQAPNSQAECVSCSQLVIPSYCSPYTSASGSIIYSKRVCEDGFYITDDKLPAERCAECRSGYSCANGVRSICATDTPVSGDGYDRCYACPDNYAITANSAVCTILPGYRSLSDAKDATADEIRDGVAFATAKCVADGQYCVDNVVHYCLPGSQPNAARDGCDVCPAGTFSADGVSCEVCDTDNNLYGKNGETGQSACLLCQGTISLSGEPGVATCNDCNVGEYYANKDDGEPIFCHACSAIKANDPLHYCHYIAGTYVITPCKGIVSSSDAVDDFNDQCTLCTSFHSSRGLENAPYCKLDGSSYVHDECPVFGAINAELTLCTNYTTESAAKKYVTADHYAESCADLQHSSYCHATPYAADEGATSYYVRSTCGDGKYISDTDRTVCEPCPAGSYCRGTTETTLCTSLNANNYCKVSAEGTVQSMCEPGNHVTADRMDCLACDRSNIEFCPTGGYVESCDLGNYLGEDMLSCTACGPDAGSRYYCPNQLTRRDCPSGAVCSATELVSCAPGSYLVPASGQDIEGCTVCPANSWCDGTTSVVTCDAGLISGPGSSSADFCIEPKLSAGVIAGISIGVAAVILIAGVIGLHFAIRRPKSQEKSAEAATDLMEAMGVM